MSLCNRLSKTMQKIDVSSMENTLSRSQNRDLLNTQDDSPSESEDTIILWLKRKGYIESGILAIAILVALCYVWPIWAAPLFGPDCCCVGSKEGVKTGVKWLVVTNIIVNGLVFAFLMLAAIWPWFRIEEFMEDISVSKVYTPIALTFSCWFGINQVRKLPDSTDSFIVWKDFQNKSTFRLLWNTCKNGLIVSYTVILFLRVLEYGAESDFLDEITGATVVPLISAAVMAVAADYFEWDSVIALLDIGVATSFGVLALRRSDSLGLWEICTFIVPVSSVVLLNLMTMAFKSL